MFFNGPDFFLTLNLPNLRRGVEFQSEGSLENKDKIGSLTRAPRANERWLVKQKTAGCSGSFSFRIGQIARVFFKKLS
jgi:hypothetical protein